MVAPRGLVIAWAFFVAAALVLAVGVGAQAADMATPFAIPHAYRLLVGTELFLVLVVYRLWVALGKGGPGFWWVVALLALAGPAVVATAWMSEAGAARVAMSQGYLVAGAFFVSAMPRRAGGLYWALVVGCGAGAPMVAFVAHDNLGVGLGGSRHSRPSGRSTGWPAGRRRGGLGHSRAGFSSWRAWHCGSGTEPVR